MTNNGHSPPAERMRFTTRRNIMGGLGAILLFNGIVMVVFYLSTVRCLETFNKIQAAAGTRFAARDLLAAMELQIRQTRWISGIAGLFSVLSVAAASIISVRDFGNRYRGEEHLRQNEERFRQLVESAKEYAIIRLGPEGLIETWNAGAERSKGYKAQEIIGRHCACFYPPEEIERGQPEMELKSALEMGQYETDGWRLRKDGSRFWGNVVITPLRDAVGQHLGYSVISRDLTDHNRSRDAISELNETLRQQNLKLTVANAELESFCYSVSHDLRSPLRSIDGFSQTLLEDYTDKLDAEGNDQLHRIRAASQRMGQLIDGLLELSRLTRSEMLRETVDLSALAREIAEELRVAAPKREVDFVIADGLTTEGDPRMVRIVLANLLGNAWKFTARRPRATIEFGRSVEDDAEVFFVRDNGAGFDMKYSQKLFGAFQRLHLPADFAGHGIGLATVKRIVSRHGGRAWAQAAADVGATFYFTFQSAASIPPASDDATQGTTKEQIANVA
jgi:PAS domain S-box-containing protein